MLPIDLSDIGLNALLKTYETTLFIIIDNNERFHFHQSITNSLLKLETKT